MTIRCIVLLSSLVAIAPLLAATRTWTGGPQPPTWSNPANWGGSAPVAGDDLVFPTATASNRTITNDLAAGTEFNSISTDAQFLSLDGNAIALGAGGLTATGLNSVAIHIPIRLTATQTWSGDSQVLVYGDVDVSGETFTFDSVLGFVMIGVVSGSGQIVVIQGGQMFSAANTFSGTITTTGGGVSVFSGSLTAPYLQTGGDLAFYSNATVGSLDIRGGTIEPGNGNGGPNSTIGNAGNVRLAPAVRYFEVVRTPDPSTGFANMRVTGTVNLAGATLDLFEFAPVNLNPGDQLMIIVNDGSDAVTGTFAGLPESAIFNVGAHDYRISYVAGTGNDVAVYVLGPSTTTLSSTPNPSFAGQNVTLTATVTGAGAATGTVTFREGTTVLGTATVGGGGVATLTINSLAPGIHTITAAYGGDNTFTSSTSNAITQVVNQPPANVPTLSWAGLVALMCGLAIAGAVMKR